MKLKLFTLVMLALVAATASGQEKNYAFYKQRSETNLKYLSNDKLVMNRVKIDDKGVFVYTDHGKSKYDLNLYWTDLPKFVDIVHNWDYYQMVGAFMSKGTQAFSGPKTQVYEWYNPLPDTTQANELFVVIDPGHFAGTWDEAVYESRYVKVSAKDAGVKTEKRFFEADLTWCTSAIFKNLIKERWPGMTVELTREYGKSSLGKTFEEWYATDFKTDLEQAKRSGDITAALYKQLKDSTTNKKFVFEKFFRFKDARKRIQKTNDVHPTFTFVIHYNADENNHRIADGYLKPVEENYNMVFVPGAFLGNELDRVDHKVDFFRLLTGDDLQNSIRMGSLIMKHAAGITGVPPLAKENDLKVVKDFCVPTDYEGVYCRNLGILRMIRGVITYSEFLIQDNKTEIHKLAMKDYEFTYDGKKYKTSKRCYEHALSLVMAMEEYLLQNSELKNKAQEAKQGTSAQN